MRLLEENIGSNLCPTGCTGCNIKCGLVTTDGSVNGKLSDGRS